MVYYQYSTGSFEELRTLTSSIRNATEVLSKILSSTVVVLKLLPVAFIFDY